MLYTLSNLFLSLINISITACFFALAVFILRTVFKKMPKAINCVLWGLVALRLIFPFSIESVFSLIPSRKTFPESIIRGETFEIASGISMVDDTVNEYLADRYYEGVTVPTNNGANIMETLSVIWIFGVFAMLIYAIVSFLMVKRKVNVCQHLNEYENVYLADNIDTAFILGFIKPKIFVPSNISNEDMELVLAHENAHIKRKDHFIKPLGFLILSVYWFNPVIWFCFVLFCKDIEGACDERVLKTFGAEVKKNYSKALINLSTMQKRITACPIAFGENDVKSRVKSILNYKKPAFWIVIASIAATVIASICFLTNPKESRIFPMSSQIMNNSISSIEPDKIVNNIKKILNLPKNIDLYLSDNTCQIILNDKLNVELPTHIQFYYFIDNTTYYSQLQFLYNSENDFYVTEGVETDYNDFSVNMLYYLEALKYLPQKEIKEKSSEAKYYKINMLDVSPVEHSENIIEYSSGGVSEIGGYALRLLVSYMKDGNEENTFAGDGTKVELSYLCNGLITRKSGYESVFSKKIVKSTDLDEAIHLALLSEYTSADFYNAELLTEGHIIYGKESKDSKLFVYLYRDIKGCSFTNGNFVYTSGCAGPAVIIFEKTNDSFILKEQRYAFDGSEYAKSIWHMMPQKYYNMALKNLNKNEQKSIINQCSSQAKEYLESIGRDAEIYDYSQVEHIFPEDLFNLTTEQSNALGVAIDKFTKFNSEMGNYEKLVNGKRIVFETEYDLEKNRIILTEYEYDSKKVIEYHEFNAYDAKEIKDINAPTVFVPRKTTTNGLKKGELTTIAVNDSNG